MSDPLRAALLEKARREKQRRQKTLGQTIKENIFGDDDPTTQNLGETIGSLLNMGGEAMTFGVIGDEASAAAESALGLGSYEGRRDHYRQQQKITETDHPGLSLTAQIAGGAIVPGRALATAGGMGKAMVRGAMIGAPAAGTYAAMESEGDLYDRAKAGAYGSFFGAIVGAGAVPIGRAVSWVAQKYGPRIGGLFRNHKFFRDGDLTDEGRAAMRKAGVDPDEVSARFHREFKKSLDAGTKPQDAAAVAEMGEFGIPAYRANVTGSADDFATVERARRMGGRLETQAREALDTQDAAMRNAADDLATRYGGGSRGDQGDAAAAVMGAAQRQSAAQKAAASAAYDAADAAGMKVRPDVAAHVSSRVNTRLAAEEVDLTLSQFPQARGFMSRLAARGRGRDGVSLRLLDGMRKDLNRAMRTADGEDFRALSIIKQEYDDWLDEVVEAGLFSGNPGALDKLKEARTLFADYARKYRGKDATSKFLQDMIDADASPDQVARWLFGTGKMGTGKMTSTVAKGLRETFGEDSEAWALLRQGAFRQMTQKPAGMTQWGPQKLSENLMDFVNSPRTRELSQTLFSAAEIAEMRRFASAMKRMVPPPGAVNYSNTAYENARMVRAGFTNLMRALGFSGGGVSGAATGDVLARGAQTGSDWLTSRKMLSVPGAAIAPNAGTFPRGAATVLGGALGATTAESQRRPQ